MVRPVGKATLGVYVLLAVGALAVCVWQHAEHKRFERNAVQTLVNRGRDITSTLGVVVRSQRRFGGVVSKARLQSALHDLIRPGETESIVILSGSGEPIASAGKPVEFTPEMLRARGVYWRETTLILMNLTDLGAEMSEDPSRPPSTIVVPDLRVFRPPTPSRRPAETFGRPSWMSKEEYDAIIQKQGVHSLVISLSTVEMRQAVRNDLLLRALLSALAVATAFGVALAWRNVRKTAELQIRLVKAGEMNTHLSEMNFAAAGLAHETRNPLNLIRGLAQMITLEAKDAQQKAHAATITEEADRVTAQLNEFIHYSKPREAHPAPVDLGRLTADVTRTLQPDVEDKQLRIAFPDTPVTVMADEPLLRQALFNLLLNATQAVAAGGAIEVHWSRDETDEALLEVRDDGPGVPVADRVAIFKPYVTMRPKGVGLGLAIVQQIVLAHGWTIECDGNTPTGAVFRIRHLKLATGAPTLAT